MVGEKCGVFGAISTKEVFNTIYYGLYSMQHRGQESAGIALYTDRIRIHKHMGLVSDVFKDMYLEGHRGIGHVRYSTYGPSEFENAQPFLIHYSKGAFAIAHNGNTVNCKQLKEILKAEGAVFTTTSDTEIIAQLIAHEHNKSGNFVEGIKSAMEKIRGSYSLTILFEDKLIGVRDPYGIRPLVLAEKDGGYIISSESCAADVTGYALIRDVKPSEIVVVDAKGLTSHMGPKANAAHCMFEYVYFSRPDSIINGVSVYQVRKNLGMILAKEDSVEADLVVAVPDSGITAAIGYSEASGIPYSEALMKNRYVGRTFILPEQNQRDIGVRVKLNPILSEVDGKRLVLVDDSIVRGTTLGKIIELIRRAGAVEIHVRISCPPIRHPCFYGIDMQISKEFIANEKSVNEIGESIGSDSLVYTSIDGLIKAIGLSKEHLCLACLNGEYPIEEKKILQ